MSPNRPSQEWIQKCVAEVTAKYRPDPRCDLPAWEGGPPCELRACHLDAHVATGPFTQPEWLFDGPIPSNTRKGVVYHVKVSRFGGRAECTCPGYRYNGRDCSHIRRVREVVQK
jgi:hypothetical protein